MTGQAPRPEGIGNRLPSIHLPRSRPPSILVRPVIHQIRKQMLPTKSRTRNRIQDLRRRENRMGRELPAGKKKLSPIPAQHLTKKPEALREFSEQPPEVQSLIRNALALTEQNLGYKYGSADPGAGGMDCSGFI